MHLLFHRMMPCRIIMNLCKMACGDPAETPSASAPDPPDESSSSDGPPASTTDHANGGEAPSQDPTMAAAAVARQVLCIALSLHNLPDTHARSKRCLACFPVSLPQIEADSFGSANMALMGAMCSNLAMWCSFSCAQETNINLSAT